MPLACGDLPTVTVTVTVTATAATDPARNVVRVRGGGPAQNGAFKARAMIACSAARTAGLVTTL